MSQCLMGEPFKAFTEVACEPNPLCELIKFPGAFQVAHSLLYYYTNLRKQLLYTNLPKLSRRSRGQQ
jgi:hypothetical protein